MVTKSFIIAAKVVLFTLLVWFIAKALFLQANFSNQATLLWQQLCNGKSYLLLCAVCLMPLNWLLEVLKWKLLLAPQKNSILSLAKGVFAGVTFGFVTPGRSGEFVGRAIYAAAGDRARVFYLSTIGGIAQTAVTLVCGVIFLSFWSSNAFLNGTAIGVAAIFLLLYFRFDWLNKYLNAFPFLNKHKLVISNQHLPPLSTQAWVLLVSLLRYGIYLCQYVLVFSWLNISDSTFVLLVHNGVLLTIQTFSPFIPLFDSAFRGSAALYVYQNITGNYLAVLTAALVVWLVNLVLPALAGYIFIVRKNEW